MAKSACKAFIDETTSLNRLGINFFCGNGTHYRSLTLATGDGYELAVKGKESEGALVLGLVGDKESLEAKGIQAKAVITPLEGGWARIESFSGKLFGQRVVWP